MGKKKSFFYRLAVNIKRHPLLYLMILPVFAYFIVYHYLPMYGLSIALVDYVPTKGIWGSKFVGAKYFKSFLSDPYFFRTMRNTLTINLQLLIFGFPFPIIFAILLNELRFGRLRKLTQTVTYMPHFISSVVICGLMLDFCSSKGALSAVIGGITGNSGVNLFSKSAYFQPLYVLMSIWQEFGWDSIIYFAALSGIDPTLYEAAEIDGANRWKKILNVTLPGIVPTIIILLIMRIGNMMTLGWDKILLLYNPMIYETADVISTYVYRIGLTNFQYSFATAIGFFNAVINFLLLISANKISKKFTDSGLW